MVSLDILQDIHTFCAKNNISYSLTGGSLIGAIRHNGFIPWDDDIDILMPRPDYDRFINTYKSEKGYHIRSSELPDSIEKGMSYPNTRVYENEKTYVDTGVLPWIKEEVGIWVDILPCDGMPSDEKEAKKHLRSIWYREKQVNWSILRDIPWSYITKGHDFIQKRDFVIKKCLSHIWSLKSFDKFLKVRKKYDYVTSSYFLGAPKYGMKEWQPKRRLEKYELHDFEGKQFFIMSRYDENLTALFGDYMKLPPEEKRFSHSINKYYWRS